MISRTHEGLIKSMQREVPLALPPALGMALSAKALCHSLCTVHSIRVISPHGTHVCVCGHPCND